MAFNTVVYRGKKNNRAEWTEAINSVETNYQILCFFVPKINLSQMTSTGAAICNNIGTIRTRAKLFQYCVGDQGVTRRASLVRACVHM